MAITKAKKRDIIAKLEAALSGVTSAVFVRFHGLSVRDTTSMRKTLRESGVGYVVAKKTLLKRALGEKFSGTIPELEGEIALAYTKEDATLPPRQIYEHGKKFKGALTIVGGIFENAFKDALHMTAIATIPPIPVLRGMFVNVINSPIQGLVIALDQIAKKKS